MHKAKFKNVNIGGKTERRHWWWNGKSEREKERDWVKFPMWQKYKFGKSCLLLPVSMTTGQRLCKHHLLSSV